MKKYRCPNCKEVFVGTQEICPKCGVKLRYADKEKEKKPVVEEATTVSNFVFSDPDVVKHEEKFVPVTTLDSADGPADGQDAVQAPLGVQPVMFGPQGESFFDGKALPRIGVRIAAFFLILITLGFGTMWAICYIYRWETSHTVIQGHRLKFTGKGGKLFGRYLLWLLLIPLTIGIILIYAQIFVRRWLVKYTEFADQKEILSMKKKIILLPLLALMLTACDLSSLMNNGGGNKEPAESREKSLNVKELAFKVADFVSVFPEIGDELDMGDYVTFDAGTGYSLDQFTFESTQPDVISINNYRAVCLKKGYAGIKVGHPDLGDRKIEISCYVGSIAGTYRMDSSSFKDAIKLEIVEGTEGYNFTLDVVDNGKKFNRRDIVSYNGGGTLIKNISPFLPMNFDSAAPSSFEPIGSFLIDLVGEENLGEFKDLTNNVYGFMAADPTEGVIIKMRFNESFVDLIAQ